MTLKKRIILSVAWLLLCVVIGFAAVIFVATGEGSSADRTARAGLVGTGMGTVVGIGWAGLWLPYAAAMGKQRRAERERARRKKKKQRG